MRTEFPVSDEGIKQLKIQVLRELSASPYPREALGKIAMKNKITVDDVKALVERHGWPDAGAMGRAAEVLDGKAPPQPAIQPRPKPPANGSSSTPVGSTLTVSPTLSSTPPANSTEQMIAAAEKSTKARTRRLAIKIRKDLAELRGLVVAERKEVEAAKVQAEETARLKAEVAELERQLAEKKAALRPAPRATSSEPAKPRNDDAKKIRAWAAEHSVDCPAFGRVPRDVVEAYELATGESTPGGVSA